MAAVNLSGKAGGSRQQVGVLAQHPGVEEKGRCFSWLPLSCTGDAFLPTMRGRITQGQLKKSNRGLKAFPEQLGLLPMPDSSGCG